MKPYILAPLASSTVIMSSTGITYSIVLIGTLVQWHDVGLSRSRSHEVKGGCRGNIGRSLGRETLIRYLQGNIRKRGLVGAESDHHVCVIY